MNNFQFGIIYKVEISFRQKQKWAHEWSKIKTKTFNIKFCS